MLGTTDIHNDTLSAKLSKRNNTELFCFVILCIILAVFSNYCWKTLSHSSIFQNVMSLSLLLNGDFAEKILIK
jgi:hypothetical protein